MFARVFDVRGVAMEAVGFFQFVHQHAAICHDNGEDVVEVVRYAADEFAKDFEFLCVSELVAEGLPFLEKLNFLYSATNRWCEGRGAIFQNVVRCAFF